LALAAALSLVFTPLAAQETDCDGWVTSDASVAVQFWEAATSETVSDCLNAGADANAGNESGDTPLLLAAAYNSNPDVLTVLLDAGADATAVDAGGQTPFEIVMRAGDQMGSDIFWRLFNAGMGRDYSYFDLEGRSFDAYDPLQSKFPALYDVTNVASNDVLYVRNAPRADSDIRSALLPTETGIEILYVTPDEAWGYATMLTASAHNIPTDMDTGWVSMRYMARQSEQDEVWYPLLTVCGGTEPYWSVEFDGASWGLIRHGSRYEPEEVSFLISVNYAYIDKHVVASNSLSAVITKAPINWGETNLDLGYSIDLVIHDVPTVFDGDHPNVIAPSYLKGSCTITPNPWGRRRGD
jgi:hypothetical protein